MPSVFPRVLSLAAAALLAGCQIAMPGPDVAGLPGPNDPGPTGPTGAPAPRPRAPQPTPQRTPLPPEGPVQTPPAPSGSGRQTAAFDPHAVGPSLAELDQMASHLLQAGAPNTGLRGYIVEDPQRSGGVAAISYGGPEAVIFVDPGKRRAWSYNTWAFIMGHELCHALLNHQPPGNWRDEHASDKHGATLAYNAGYYPEDYVAFICSLPDVCSQSHGCFHDRMVNLEEQFNVQACGLDPSAHHDHEPAGGAAPAPMPPGGGCGGCIYEGQPCNPADGHQCEITTPVAETIPCRHLRRTPEGLIAIHPDGDLVYDMETVKSPVCLKQH